MGKGRIWWIVLCASLAPAAASAQTAWDAPLLLPPRPADGFGIFLTDMHAGGVGVMGTWQSPIWNFGMRAGISEGPNRDDLAIFGGIDYMGPINTATADFPLDIDWVFAVGAALSDGLRASLPLGLSAGHSFQAEGARFQPYLTPRVALDAFFGRDRGPDDLRSSSGVRLGIAVDLGLDVHLTGTSGPFAGTTIRFGFAMGDRNAIGLGVVF
jgi:hypothetical protein